MSGVNPFAPPFGNPPFQSVLAASGGPFGPTSRYYQQPTRSYVTPDGNMIVYVSRRFLPQPSEFSLLQNYSIRQGDRLDNLTATFLGDPEQYWRIADANAAMKPDDLTATVGATLRITLPQGIPGAK